MLLVNLPTLTLLEMGGAPGALILFPWIIIVMLLVNLLTLMRLWRLSHWGQNVDRLLVILDLL